jgi:Domain of unknown function (DUF4872)/Butirosin biosynthesis protein H, N-terminal
MGGRAVSKPGMEQLAGQRTGVTIVSHTTSSLAQARQALLERLSLGQPVMLQVDMGFLPYFNFGGQEYHFGGHVIVACGYDQEKQLVLVADRDGTYPVPLAQLELARSSSFKPFPPKNCWWVFDFNGYRPPDAVELRAAIAAQASAMLEPPIRNFGVEGIRQAARRIPCWPSLMSSQKLRLALFNMYIFISPVGGTGGGLFRYMFSRFLEQVAGLTSDERLSACAEAFSQIGDAWESLAARAKQVSAEPDLANCLGECTAPLLAIASQEQAAWESLQKIVLKP